MTQTRVAVAWYTRDQWAAVRAMATDPDNLAESYEDWILMAERTLSELARTGIILEKVAIDGQALHAWCQQAGRPVDTEARAAFAAELLWQREEPAGRGEPRPALALPAVPLFVVSNHHGGEAGAPPTFSGDTPEVYHSYFENAYGEQSVFVYEWDTARATLWCGDAGWQSYRVIDGRVEGVLQSAAEQLWLQACWLAVTGPTRR
jgi:hypothetical protein